MRKGIITLLNEERYADRVAKMAFERGDYEIEGYYPILEGEDRVEIGQLVCIKGGDILVPFLEMLTEYRGKDAKKVEVDR